MVCFDRTSIFICTNGVDISGIHVLTFSMQIIALDDCSHKNTQKTLYWYNLGKISMLRIPKHLRERVIGMLEAGASTEKLSVQVGSSVQAVRSLRRQFVQTGSTEDLPRRGRPRVTTPAQDRYILNQHLRNRFLTVTATASVTPSTHNSRISAQTVRNRLAENNLRARRPYVGTILTDRHCRDRLQWADRHINWKRQDWRTVLFSDESRFALSNSDGRIRVYRRRGER